MLLVSFEPFSPFLLPFSWQLYICGLPSCLIRCDPIPSGSPRSVPRATVVRFRPPSPPRSDSCKVFLSLTAPTPARVYQQLLQLHCLSVLVQYVSASPLIATVRSPFSAEAPAIVPLMHAFCAQVPSFLALALGFGLIEAPSLPSFS